MVATAEFSQSLAINVQSQEHVVSLANNGGR